LTDLPLMARARRAKQTYSSEQCDQIRTLMEEFRQAFAKIRLEYAKFKEHTQ
jgi:V/A-type H+-transporting ATPase subunit A